MGSVLKLRKKSRAAKAEAVSATIQPEEGAVMRTATQEPPPPWDGTLSLEELSRDTPAALLLAMLYGRAAQLKHTTSDMCAALAVTYSYLSLLRNNHRELDKVGDSLIENAAAYLGVPKLHVMMAVGKVKPQDALTEPTKVGTYLAQAVAHMHSDPVWAPYVPKSLDSAPVDLKFLAVLLFEAATGKTLLPQRKTPEEIAKEVQQLQNARARMLKKLHAEQ